MIEEFAAPHMAAVRARGLRLTTIIRTHVLRNTSVALLTIVGWEFVYGLAGYFALLDALRAARRDGPGMYDLPLTPEKALDYLMGQRPEFAQPGKAASAEPAGRLG